MNQVNTKYMFSKYYNYLDSCWDELWDCYNSCSSAKREAFEDCKRKCKQYHGHDLRIISANRYEFTVGFIGEWEGKDAFFYISNLHDWVMLKEDLNKYFERS